MPDQDEQDILYYYCDLKGLLGIVESHCLWLSNIFFLNDADESRWFRRIVEKRLEAYKAERELHIPSFDQGTAEYERLVLEHIHLIRLSSSLTRNNEFTNHSVVCFSEHEDALSQWRGYGDDGYGFAIGFDKAHLEYDPSVRLIKIDYDKDEQEVEARNMIDEAFAARAGDEIAVAHAVDLFENRVFERAACCKNESFNEEKEWRLIYNPLSNVSLPMVQKRDGVKFRARGRDLIPYYCWPLEMTPPYNTIRKVVLGPKNRKREQEEAIESLLVMNGFHNVDVIHSKLTYR